MAEQSGGTQTPQVPPSFVPSSARRKTKPSGVQSSGDMPPTFSTVRKASAGTKGVRQHQIRDSRSPSTGTAPASIQPDPRRVRRRSAGSTSNAVVSAPSQRRSAAPSEADILHKLRPVQTGHDTGSHHPQRVKHRHRVWHWMLALFTLLIVTAIVTVFTAWNWADSRLDKANWLTSHPNSGGTSWLIVGSDERDKSGLGGTAEDTPGFRTDTILVLTKPIHGPSSLISIPRDSLVKVDGEAMKINAVAQLHSKNALVGEVEDITGKKIDHVAEVKFNGLKSVVDALGGVNLCYDQNVSDQYSGLTWQAGCHIANGDTALAFSRMRYSDQQGDFGRAARQRQVIAAITKKSLTPEILHSPKRVTALADTALRSIEVDSKTNPATLVSMATAFKSATGPGAITGSVYWTDPDYYPDNGIGSCVLLDDARNAELFNELAAGTHRPGVVGSLTEAQNAQ